MDTNLLLFGIVFGLAAGLSPGPLMTLVVSETLKNGRKEGIEIAFSPLISEAPIILSAMVILSITAENTVLMGAISLSGACFLVYLGFSNLRTNVKESEYRCGRNNALLRGITTNLLNPNTYMFWLTIGGPRILETARFDTSATILFILGFYVMLIGSQTTVAVIVDRSKALVSGKYYTYIIQALGAMLIVFALTYVRDALEFIGIL